MIDTLYLVHHTHTDIGFTHAQEVVLDLHDQFIDQALDLCEQTADYPAGSALRWTCECTWPVLHWLRHRDDRRIERFLQLERAGRIEVTGMFAVLSQCLSAEATWRQLDPVRHLRDEYGLTIRSAMQCDINGQHWGLIEALRATGIDNLAMAINENVGRAPWRDQRPNGFHWQSPSGNTILAWNGLHYNNNQYFGIPDDHDRAVAELPRLLDWLEARDYPHSFCLLQPTHNSMNDNGPPWRILADFVRRWNAEARQPRLEIVTLSTFFDRLREDTVELPTVRGEWTDFWNFGAVSTAYETMLNRGTERRLGEAEWLLNLAGSPEARRQTVREAWELALLYDEHTWCANVSVTRPWSPATRSQTNQKLNLAYRARAKTQLVRLETADRLAHDIAASPGRYVVAFNPLPWAQTQRLDIPAAWLDGWDVVLPQLVTDENAPRPHGTREVHDCVSRVQYLDREDMGEQQDLAGGDTLVSVPVEVPPMGYRLCTRHDLRPQPAGAWTATDGAADNARFAVRLDAERGGIASLVDKARDREWVAPSDWPLGAYVYEQIATASPDQQYGGRQAIFEVADWSRFMGYGPWHADWPAVRRGIDRVVSQSCRRDSGSTRLRQVCEAPGLRRYVCEVILDDDRPWIDLRLTLDKEWVEEPEACYLVFPFALHGAVPRYETVGGIVEPSTDQIPGCCQDYHTIQGWADWSTNHRGMTICTPDAPIGMFGGFHFGRMHDGPRPATPATFLSMTMTNYYHTNYVPAQHGPVTFSYRLCPHDAFDVGWSTRRGREAASPVWAHPVKDPAGARPPQGSLLSIDNPAIDLVSCEPGADGPVLRLRNLTDRQVRDDALGIELGPQATVAYRFPPSQVSGAPA